MFEYKILNKAYYFALEKHKDQKYGEKDFLYHPLQVYEIISLIKPTDLNLRVAALLHDCMESGSTKNEIQEIFGEDVANLVEEVTKTDWNRFPNLKTQRGILLKYADRSCNISNIDDWPKEKQQRYLNKSIFWKK